MRLKMNERKKVTEVLSKRYQKARKKEKNSILNEYVSITGYNRSYASHLLNNWGKKRMLMVEGKVIAVVLGKPRKRKKRHRPRIYGENIKVHLKKLWAGSGFLCGKMLKGYIEENLEIIEKCNELCLTDEERGKIKAISASTIDRMFQKDKKRMALKKRSGTKPGYLLKNRIPIRTFRQWDENKAGFIEIDLVEHNGGNPSGEYIYTLNSTDIKTCWVETQAVLNKAQVRVFNALKKIEERFPFDILGIDSDNGGEFINHQLVKYCDKTKKNFTRSRAGNKNDSCYVEQKNYTVVRKEIGYRRHEGNEELGIMNRLYKKLRQLNYFTPVRKKISAEQRGSKRIKKYDEPKTPYSRTMQLTEIPKEVKEKLTKERENINPIQLRKDILTLQRRLDRAADKRKKKRKVENFKAFQDEKIYVYC